MLLSRRNELLHSVILAVTLINAIESFVPSSNCWRGRPKIIPLSSSHSYWGISQSRIVSHSLHATDKKTSEPLSELDARVLESILKEDNLDLSTEENLKKLLERGVKKDTSPINPTIDDESDSEFSSTILKTITDSKLWNSLKAKTDAVLESARIYIENRVERDAKLLASIGIFAWDRIQQDVSRALPSAGRSGADMANKMRKALFQLSSNSSFVEYVPKDNFILGPSKYGENANPPSIYDQLNTPMDEIKSVTESIRDILSGKNIPSSSSTSQRGLKSVSPGGSSQNSQRQRKAYQRRKETKLAREKETVDKKVARAAGTVVDAAWEIKRELNVEGNQPGYRTEKIREQAMLAASAGTKEISKLLGGGNKATGKLGPGSDNDDRNILEAGTFIEEKSSTSENLKIGEESAFFYAVAQDQSAKIDNSKTLDRFELSVDTLMKERSRFLNSLSLCLDQPENTWLSPDSTDMEFPENLDDNALREVVTTMILTRDDLDSEIADVFLYGSDFDNVKILEKLELMNTYTDNIVSLAAICAGYGAAEKLRAELIGMNEDEIGLLSSLDDVREYVEIAEQEREKKKQQSQQINLNYFTQEVSIDESNQIDSAEFEFSDFSMNDDDGGDVPVEVSVADVLPIDAETKLEFSDDQFVITKSSLENKFVDTDVVKYDIYDENTSSTQNLVNDDFTSTIATVEIVTDDENIEERFTDVKTAATNSEDETEREEKPNILLTLTLRSFDVLFYVVEKTITVGIPGTFSLWERLTKRTKQINEKGLGTEGWKTINNAKNGKKRY